MNDREPVVFSASIARPAKGSFHEAARAKINLSLHVTGYETDANGNGYHQLDSLVAFATVSDFVEIIPAHDMPGDGQGNQATLEVIGPYANPLEADGDNLVLAAANQLANLLKDKNNSVSPVHLKLYKNLPVASGIGGGSADAAATLRLLQRCWNIDDSIDLYPLATSLGADVPMCLMSGNLGSGNMGQSKEARADGLRARGNGTILEPISGIGRLHLVLINPAVAVYTPAVFKALTQKQNPEMPALPEDGNISSEYLANLRNDLQAPAISLCPIIENVLEKLQQQDNCIVARMSGSGATCFGLFDSLFHARKAAEKLAANHPDWWVVATPTQ